MRTDIRTGSVLAGFRIDSLIGEGAMGTVYLAEDTRRGGRVALKVLVRELADDERFRRRFLRESKLAASLDHPNVVPVLDAGEEDGVLFLAMAYVEGSDLREVLRHEGSLDPERALSLVAQVAGALDAAHALGLVHRDVKPGNILITGTPTGEHAYVCDFGLARHVSSASSLTTDRGLVGTIDYIPPEQIEGGDIDGRADVYSLGVILFRCLSGNVPFESESLVDMLRLVTTAPRPSLQAARPDLPKSVDAWAAKALAVDRAQRFESVRSLWKGLLQALEYTPPPRVPRPVAESLVGAWRAATSVFRRFIEAASAGIPGAASTAGASPLGPDEDGDRPTLIFKRPALPSVVPETSDIDEGWEEVADSEIHSSRLGAQKAALRPPPLPPTHDGWEEVHEPDSEPSARKPKKAKAAARTGAKASGGQKGAGKPAPKKKARPAAKKAAPAKKAAAKANKKKTLPKKKASSSTRNTKSRGRKKPARKGRS